MSFAGRDVPSVILTDEARGGGAPGFVSASSFSRTAATTRTVAVAWTTAETCGACDWAIARAAAKSIMGVNANAVARKW